MRPEKPFILVSGMILMVLGALFVLSAGNLRDRTIRRMQPARTVRRMQPAPRALYVVTLQGLGTIMLIAGAVILVAAGFGRI